jgi:hypothetical protein
VIAADTDRWSVDRDHGNNDDDDDGIGDRRVNENEVGAVDDRGVSHVFLPVTRHTFIYLFH